MYFTAEDMACIVGGVTMGLIPEPEIMKNGGRVHFSTGGEWSLCADSIAQAYVSQDVALGQRQKLKGETGWMSK
jgi:hypothetical protein